MNSTVLQTNKLTIKSSGNNVYIHGYASVFNNIDCHNDIIIKGAFQNAITQHKTHQCIKLLWQHDVTKPIGIVSSITEDTYGLIVEGNINKETQQGKEAISLVQQGAISGLSVGFTIKQSTHNSEGYREIVEADLWEVSIVTFPANNEAHINYVTCKNQLNDLRDTLVGANHCLQLLIKGY